MQDTMDKKRILTGIVLENDEIAAGVYKMTVESVDGAPLAKPGQFVNVYTKDASLLLPRPISICFSDGAELTLVYGVVGKGTEEFSTYKRGDEIRHSMPQGNGYDLDAVKPGQKAMLLGGGIGVPPLLSLCYELTAREISVTAVIGFKDEPFLIKPLLKAGADLYVATDSGAVGFKGTVLDVLKNENLKGDAYFACGPRVMLKAVTDHVLAEGRDIQVSMEERMGCGYGACVGCVCDIREKSGAGPASAAGGETIVKKKVCKDGPVFWGSEVVWDGK